MNYHFSRNDRALRNMMKDTFAAIRGAYRDELDGCVVTKVRCANCGKEFEEELEEAKAKILRRELSFCLFCDQTGEVRDITAVIVRASSRSCS